MYDRAWLGGGAGGAPQEHPVVPDLLEEQILVIIVGDNNVVANLQAAEGRRQAQFHRNGSAGVYRRPPVGGGDCSGIFQRTGEIALLNNVSAGKGADPAGRQGIDGAAEPQHGVLHSDIIQGNAAVVDHGDQVIDGIARHGAAAVGLLGHLQRGICRQDGHGDRAGGADGAALVGCTGGGGIDQRAGVARLHGIGTGQVVCGAGSQGFDRSADPQHGVFHGDIVQSDVAVVRNGDAVVDLVAGHGAAAIGPLRQAQGGAGGDGAQRRMAGPNVIHGVVRSLDRFHERIDRQLGALVELRQLCRDTCFHPQGNAFTGRERLGVVEIAVFTFHPIAHPLGRLKTDAAGIEFRAVGFPVIVGKEKLL